MSFRPHFSLTDPMAAALARVDGARCFLAAAKLPHDWVAAMRARALLLEAHHTARLDGARLTREDVAHALAGDGGPAGDPDRTRALRNYRDAFEFAGRACDEGRPLTEDLVREVHGRLGGWVGAAGQYRAVDGYVIDAATRRLVYGPPSGADVPALVRDLVAWWADPGGLHPVLAAGIGQFHLAHIHPFLADSGRTSRLLALFGLWRAGCDVRRLCAPSQYCDRNRPVLSRARQRARESGMDLTGWLELFAEGVAGQLEDARSQGEREMRRDVVTRHALTERQAAAVWHVLERGRLAIGDFERLCPGIPRRALQRDLKQLVDRGLLRRSGPANRPQYLTGAAIA